MRYKQSIKSISTIVLALCLLVTVLLGGWQMPPAYAAVSGYSEALDDLQGDIEFSIDDYPSNTSDYSIQVIQIAESTNKELFVYTYQPSQLAKYLVATQINMSLTESADKTKLYGLTLLSCNGVFCKYKVNDFTVGTQISRYYNITSIYREWDSSIDKGTGNDNTKNAVAFAVGKLYKATTSNGAVTYSCTGIETIQIINPYADYLEYSNGFKLSPNWCHSHYVAFSTDKKIDTLMEADVSYVRRSASRVTGIGLKGDAKYENPTQEIAELDGKQKGGNAADGWFSKKYEWERIQSVSEFIAKENLKDETKANLESKQWVLRFVETEISMIIGQGTTITFWTDISQVTVLRLKFVTDGKVYNLGAVSDKVTGDNKPGNNNTNEFASLLEWLSRLTNIPEWALILIAVVIVLVILMPILSIFFPIVGQVLWKIIKTIGKMLWKLICLPFKAIKALFQKIKDSKGGG
ncbi:MAG: hypothetical protein K2I46_02060 [Clostridia bacterium]|nr:hypothetical protein [Clostridia bacterium]